MRRVAMYWSGPLWQLPYNWISRNKNTLRSLSLSLSKACLIWHTGNVWRLVWGRQLLPLWVMVTFCLWPWTCLPPALASCRARGWCEMSPPWRTGKLQVSREDLALWSCKWGFKVKLQTATHSITWIASIMQNKLNEHTKIYWLEHLCP